MTRDSMRVNANDTALEMVLDGYIVHGLKRNAWIDNDSSWLRPTEDLTAVSPKQALL
jgi:hypothetical protein